jgi:hypothetical protein
MIDRMRSVVNRLGGNDVGTIDVSLGSRSLRVKAATITKLLVALVVVSAGTFAAGFAFLGVGSQPALAADVTAEDVSISTGSGNVTGVTVGPNVTITWNNVDEPVEEVVYRICVGPSESELEPMRPHKLASTYEDFGNRSGSLSYVDGTPPDITDDVDFHGPYDDDPAPFDKSDFNASEGSTTTTTVHVMIEVQVEDADSNVITSSNSTLTSFEVSVTNTEGTVSTSGQIETNVTTPA